MQKSNHVNNFRKIFRSTKVLHFFFLQIYVSEKFSSLIMISSIQQFLQKHHRWIFGGLLGVIILAFVFTIGAAPGIVGKKRRAIFYGKNLLSQKDMQPIMDAVLISSKAMGAPLYSRQQLDHLILIRCALLSQADKLKICPPSDEILREFIKTLPGFLDEKNGFSKEKYGEFLAACERNGFGQAEVRRVLLDEQRIGALKQSVVGNGILSDHQLQSALSTLYTSYDLAVAELNYDSFLPEIAVSEDDLREFYDKHSGKYRVPEMVAVSIVRFEATQFEGGVQVPAESILREYFQAERERFNAYPDFESAKNEVTGQYLKLESRRLAGQSADEFAGALYGGDVKLNSNEWQNLLTKFGIEKEKIAAYSKLKLPKVEGIPEAALIAVCDMDPSRYYSDPFMADFGAAILIVEGRREPHLSAFDEVRECVERDVREEKRKNQFNSLVERMEKSLAGAAGEDVPSNFAKFGLTPQFFKGISIDRDGGNMDGKILRALSSMGSDERVHSEQIDGSVVFTVVLNRQTPPYADMKAKNGGDMERKLLALDRDFCFAEYANQLVEQGLSKLK